jgi:hypothetical protein
LFLSARHSKVKYSHAAVLGSTNEVIAIRVRTESPYFSFASYGDAGQLLRLLSTKAGVYYHIA